MNRTIASLVLCLFFLLVTNGWAAEIKNMEDAALLADQEMRRQDSKHYIFVARSNAEEYEFGWVFRCYPEKYLITRNEMEQIPGLYKIIVDRDGGTYGYSGFSNEDYLIKEHLEKWRAKHQ